ncbi:MAG: hypothetical protein U5K36_05560 [Roseovarius sp.]|nr:hypothetical protein [Roseovarius sp.]
MSRISARPSSAGELQVLAAGDARGGVSQFSQDVSGLGLVAATSGNAAAFLAGTAGDDLVDVGGLRGRRARRWRG